MIVRKTSVFPAGREAVFEKLKRLETLQTVARPYASFEPADGMPGVWEEGGVSTYRFRLFGLLPFGTHVIRIVRFDPERVESREHNDFVQVWNHIIVMEPIDETHTRYTDRVEIRAGWKTAFVWLWANAFYAHRQRKWIRLLKKEAENGPRP